MEVYKYKNATVRIRGEVDKEKLKDAAIQLLKKSYRYKQVKGRASK